MNLEEILAGFACLRVLVVGDLCLDRWCRYDPALADASRETGIPRVAVVASESTPGAAGTVAANAVSLGAAVDVLSATGADGFGYELRRALEERGIGSRLLFESGDFATFTYTKLINCRTGIEDLPRLDFINPRPPALDLETRLAANLESAAADYHVILVSDQAETPEGGLVTPRLRQALAGISGRVVWVDSRMRAELFRGVIVKPNQREAEEASRRLLGRVDFEELRRRMEAPLLAITHGPRGALVVEAGGSTWAPAEALEHTVDICGAGDSFSAGAAMTLAVTGDAMTAARVGNLTAAVTILKKGTGTASPRELLARYRHG